MLPACSRRLHGAVAHRIKALRMIMVNCVVYPEYLFGRADSLECSASVCRVCVARLCVRECAGGGFFSGFDSEFSRTEINVDYDQR